MVADWIEFTPEDKTFISKRIESRIKALVDTWDVPMNLREKRIVQVVADVILNLPTRPEKIPTHRKWWQLGDW